MEKIMSGGSDKRILIEEIFKNMEFRVLNGDQGAEHTVDFGCVKKGMWKIWH